MPNLVLNIDKYIEPILDDRLKEKFLKPWKGVLCIHFRVCLHAGATEHTFWPRNLIFGSSDPWDTNAYNAQGSGYTRSYGYIFLIEWMVKWFNARGIMILIKCKYVNREVEGSSSADIILKFSNFHVISHVIKTSIYMIDKGDGLNWLNYKITSIQIEANDPSQLSDE